MKTRLIFFTALWFITINSVCSQTSFRPENFGKNINSEYSEINPVISKDGKLLFFNRINHPENTFGLESSMDIWFSVLQNDGSWSLAKRAPDSVNIGQYNAILSALADGKSYFILGNFNSSGRQVSTRGFSIIERRDDGTWSRPKPIKIEGYSSLNQGSAVSAYMSPDRALIFIALSSSSNSSKLSLYVSEREKENVYSKPKMIGSEFRGEKVAKTVEAPFLTLDKNRLYFTAYYGEGKDNYDIYYVDRADEDFRVWGLPIKITDTINTPSWDSYFKMNDNESWGYFSSTNNTLGKADIFRVKIFEERPYVKVTGLILNQATQRLMLEDTTYSVLVNGVQTSNFKIDKSSASFEVKLPLGKKYTLEPRMENWNGLSSDLDLSNIREYAEAKINLHFSSIPFMLVKGKIIDEQKGQIIPLALKPIVLINGEISDSINYDYFSSSFSALLPLGEKYTFSAKVKNYNTGAVVVDVSSVSTFVERDISIPVKSVPWVEIRGKVIDNITLSPLSQETLPKVLINGQIADSIQIDANDGSFVFRLPFGYSYTMGVQTKDYKVNESVIDLTKYNEFAEITKNIYAERVDANMVVLSGKIINTKSESKLDETIEVKMRVNGMETPAFAYNSTAGTYVLKLPVGFNYDLTPSVLNFYNKFEPLDLTKAVPLSKISRDFYVTPIEIGQSVDIQDIYFQTGKAILKPESFRSLNAIIQFLNEYPNVKVEIGGHTDNVGTASVNLKISQDRATSVADYVISQGIPAERVISKGYGFSKPKASNKTEAGKAQNRRVDFTITGI